ncbi:restriction endonuclease subunit S [Sphingomonas sp. ZT3P38]|uniref:restriction endonuclease subunit S n=1 Tax=Parasphingomonas zepuensis TaxID=3096161 RepID=UPI002FC6D52A
MNKQKRYFVEPIEATSESRRERGIAMLPQGWEIRTLASVVQANRKITYGIVQPGGFVQQGVVLVRGGDYSTGWVLLDQMKRVRPEIDRPYKRSRLRAGDIVLTIVGANTGTIAVVPSWLDGANITQTTARIAVDNAKASPSFVAHALKSDWGQDEVRKYVKGAAQPGLNLEDIELFNIPFPPLAEQLRISTVLDAWDTAIANAECLVEVKRKRFEWFQAQLLTGQKRMKGFGEPWPDTHLRDYFIPRRQAGEIGLPLLSVTMNDGIVIRDMLDRRSKSAMTEEAHLLVAPGDIAYNMMRMWQGASGLCRVRGNISPAYVVMTPKDNLDPEFAAHWLKSKEAIDLLWAYSHGLTEDRLRLYPDDFLRIPVRLPPLAEQRRISLTLNCCLEDVASAERLLSGLRDQKCGLMQQLLTGKLPIPESVDALIPSSPALEPVS